MHVTLFWSDLHRKKPLKGSWWTLKEGFFLPSGRYVPHSSEFPYETDDFDNYDSFSTAKNYAADYDDSTWQVLLYPETTSSESPGFAAPTLLPLPVPDSQGESDSGGGNEINYDEKWNVGDTPNSKLDAALPGGGSGGKNSQSPSVEPESKSLPGTMVLVIGIILGAFVAMILIVIFVLKMRIRVDGNGTIKGDEVSGASAPRYQFAPPNDYGEIPGANAGGVESERETATTALMEGGSQGRGAPNPGGIGHNNGFFNNNCSSLAAAAHAAQTANGDRSRLFRKSNGSKPVREWYV